MLQAGTEDIREVAGAATDGTPEHSEGAAGEGSLDNNVDDIGVAVVPEANFRILDWVRSKNPRLFHRPHNEADDSDRLDKWLEDRSLKQGW